MELDTIKASDAFGSGSSPDGHTKENKPLVGLFSLVISERREHTRRKCLLKQKKHYRVSVRPIACDGTSALREVAPTDTPAENADGISVGVLL